MIKPDLIGREDIVNKLCSNVEKLNYSEHACIALNGVWGCGKSYVMDMVYERLEKNKNYLTIRYDAWENSYYSDPLIAIFSSIIDDATNRLTTLPGEKGMVLAGKKITSDLLEELSKKSGRIGTLATVIKKMIEYVAVYKNGLQLDTRDKKVSEFRSYQSFIKEVKDQLNRFTENKEENNKIIVLVDELDRCLPEMQLVVLERLHHLFSINNCVVLIALNDDAICKIFDARYSGNGEEYLKKFFDITYLLPQKAETFFENLVQNLKDLFKKFGNNDKSLSEGIDSAVIVLQNSKLRFYSSFSNREIEKFIECIIKICEEYGWKNLSRSHIFFIIISAFIKRFISLDFMDKNIVDSNQLKLFNQNQNFPYDYIYENLGISLSYLAPKYIEHQFEYLINCYNRMVYYSVNECEDPAINKPCVGGFFINPYNCAKLRSLIFRYAGDKNAKNEK